jgi:hypothetical protein
MHFKKGLIEIQTGQQGGGLGQNVWVWKIATPTTFGSAPRCLDQIPTWLLQCILCAHTIRNYLQ